MGATTRRRARHGRTPGSRTRVASGWGEGRGDLRGTLAGSKFRSNFGPSRTPQKGGPGTPQKGGCRDTKQCKFWRVSSVLIQGLFCFWGVFGGFRGGPAGGRFWGVPGPILGSWETLESDPDRPWIRPWARPSRMPQHPGRGQTWCQAMPPSGGPQEWGTSDASGCECEMSLSAGGEDR